VFPRTGLHDHALEKRAAPRRAKDVGCVQMMQNQGDQTQPTRSTDIEDSLHAYVVVGLAAGVDRKLNSK
jgi:hypothetical protein